ncbi:MAG: GAF domain-containing protein [Candidatus Rokubacteria bacterium]|nr:GAF domain-containing protein [Candidatus Rokubacteria bacterium]
MGEVLGAVVLAAVDLVPGSTARTWVLEHGRLVLKAEADNREPHGGGHQTVLALGEGLTGYVARNREALFLDDVLADDRTVNRDWMRREGIAAFVGLPLVTGDRLVGVLSVLVRRRHRFTADEVELLTAFGAHAAIAIQNARIFEESEARRRAAEGLARAAHALTETLDVATVGQRTVDTVLPLFGVRYVVLRLMRPDGSLVSVAAAGETHAFLPERDVQTARTGLAGRAVVEGRAVWCRDLQACDGNRDKDMRERFTGVGIRACLVTPLIAHGRTIGVLGVGHGVPHDFSDDEVRLLGAFADQAALALENARLYQAATETLDFLRSITSNSADAIVTTDVRGMVTFASPRTGEMLGYQAQDLVGRPLASYARLSAGEVRGLVVELAEAGHIRDVETVIRCADGRQLDVSVSLSLLRNDAGTVTGTVGVIRDITDRKWAERALAERVEEISRLSREAQAREAFIRNVIESLGEGLFVIDARRRIVAWNAAMERIWAMSADVVVGRPCEEIFAEMDQTFCHGIGRLLARQTDELRLEGVERRRSASQRVVLNVTGSRLGRETEPSGAVLLVEDITERVTLAHAARQAEKLAALGTLAAGTAHEINNPIGIILSRIEVMLGEAGGQELPAAFHDDLRVLQRHAQRVARIVQRLLAFSRSPCGEMAPVDLGRVVQDTIALVERQVASQGIAIRTELQETPRLLGDGNALQQVVLNLLTNAREAMAGGGELRISLRSVPGERDRVRLVVSDTGCGISSADLARIFEPFYTTKANGTGLGLAVSYGIVREHRGVIDVESEVGRGTTFTLTFPALPNGGGPPR